MGQQSPATCQHARRTSAGQALLETDSLIFRGDFRLTIPLKTITSVKADNDNLHLNTPQGKIILTLGPHAKRWADKILHPPQRLDKLNVKSDSKISLIGPFDSTFQTELAERTQNIKTRKATDCDLLFLAAQTPADFKKLPILIPTLKATGAIWIVYPRGVKTITESQVLSAGRAAGLTDNKVTRFSETHTALKFVIPVKARPKT